MEVGLILPLLTLFLCIIAAATFMLLKRMGYHRWLGAYVVTTSRRGAPIAGQDIHLILCIADHYEPRAQGASIEKGMGRVDFWVKEYPRQFSHFRDSDGFTPRHSFFFPIEEYQPEYLDALAELCRAGFGEVEIHLHHDNDTAENLRRQLIDFRDLLVDRHRLLSRDRHSGEVRYGFIHGNWALCNSRPDGRLCGVSNELDILRETGCYADFTFPSAPSETQPPIVNSIYYARDRPGLPCSHHRPSAAYERAMSLLQVQGPLILDWGLRKWGIVPRGENACLQASQPPSMRRLENWLRASVKVPNRPDWYFVKLHAHGAPEDAHEVLLGEPMVRFHQALAERAQTDPHFHYHYVTAREMVNLIKAAEVGYKGDVEAARDYVLVPALGTPIS